MDTNNWRPAPQGGEPVMDTGDWRNHLQPDSRQRIVNKIMDTLKRHLPFSGQEGLNELKKIAGRFEEKIYTAATSQSDYLRKISLKMLSMESKSENPMPNSLPPNTAGNSNKLPDKVGTAMQNQVHNQGQSLPIPLSANHSQPCQQLYSQYIQNNMTLTGLPGSSGLPFLLPSVCGLRKAPIPSVVNQNSTMQNIYGVSQNTVPSMGEGVPSNLFANSQRQMQGRQQVLPPQQQQQSQNSQQYMYQQQLQQQFLKQKMQQGNLSHSIMQQQQQQPNILQPNQLQSSQQSGVQSSSVMPLKAAFTIPAAPITLPSMMPSQKQQQLMGQPSKAANILQNQLIGQQNSVGDIEQQLHQRLLGQQSNLPKLHQQQRNHALIFCVFFVSVLLWFLYLV